MTPSVSYADTDLALIRRLRTAAAAGCARTRLDPTRRELLRDALVEEAQARWSTGEATVLALPRQRAGGELVASSA